MLNVCNKGLYCLVLASFDHIDATKLDIPDIVIISSSMFINYHFLRKPDHGGHPPGN